MAAFTPDRLDRADVLICGFDVDRAPLEAHAETVREWVRGGGVLLGFRDNTGHNGWLPSPVSQDARTSPVTSLSPALPRSASSTRSPRYAARGARRLDVRGLLRPRRGLGSLAAAGGKQSWDTTQPKSDGPHYGLIELRLGKGRNRLEPAHPEYAWLNDDAGHRTVRGGCCWRTCSPTRVSPRREGHPQCSGSTGC